MKKIKNFLFLMIATPLVLLDEFIDNFEKPSKEEVGEFIVCICGIGLYVVASAIVLTIGIILIIQ